MLFQTHWRVYDRPIRDITNSQTWSVPHYSYGETMANLLYNFTNQQRAAPPNVPIYKGIRRAYVVTCHARATPSQLPEIKTETQLLLSRQQPEGSTDAQALIYSAADTSSKKTCVDSTGLSALSVCVYCECTRPASPAVKRADVAHTCISRAYHWNLCAERVIRRKYGECHSLKVTNYGPRIKDSRTANDVPGCLLRTSSPVNPVQSPYKQVGLRHEGHPA